jgi:hypothetical protein
MEPILFQVCVVASANHAMRQSIYVLKTPGKLGIVLCVKGKPN